MAGLYEIRANHHSHDWGCCYALFLLQIGAHGSILRNYQNLTGASMIAQGLIHGRFKIIKARRAPWREGMCRCDLVWRVAVEIGRSSGMTRVFLQIRVIPGASPWP
ncbi:MAG TPA: hypothetical protein VLW83_16765, partial [Candidatus Acidoferrales bacterium]|nr:hypothetical protein [Candidatus Acidoferrales bacterium]